MSDEADGRQVERNRQGPKGAEGGGTDGVASIDSQRIPVRLVGHFHWKGFPITTTVPLIDISYTWSRTRAG